MLFSRIRTGKAVGKDGNRLSGGNFCRISSACMDALPGGVEEAVKPYKEDKAMAHLFKQEQPKPPYHPQGGTGGAGTANPFAKETFNLTKQGELLKSNPEQAKAMAAAAGVTI